MEPRINLVNPTLQVRASIVDDIESVRKALNNRLDVMTRTTEDKDGQVRGWGLSPEHADVKQIISLRDGLEEVETEAVKGLEKSMRAHPLWPWAKDQKGVGAKQFARLISTIGDPYWHPTYTDLDGNEVPAGPRTVAQLWSYCGLKVYPDGSTPRRKRGERANWSTKAKTRAFLIAQKCLVVGINRKTCPIDPELDLTFHKDDCTCAYFRKVYDERKAVTKNRLHKLDCIRCGPSGNPAKTGSPWSDAHRHADALRVVSKEILKEMWIEAKRLHEEAEKFTTTKVKESWPTEKE